MRKMIVLLVVTLMVGAAPTLFGQRKSPGKPAPSNDIPVTATFKSETAALADGDKIYSNLIDPVTGEPQALEVGGAIRDGEFVLGMAQSLVFDFGGDNDKVYANLVGISTQQDTANVFGPGGPFHTKVPLDTLAKDAWQCVQLAYAWNPGANQEQRLIFHRWVENWWAVDSVEQHRTSYALVTCKTADSSGRCNEWTIAPDEAGDCSPGAGGAMGALWDWASSSKNRSCLGECVYSMPHTITVTRP